MNNVISTRKDKSSYDMMPRTRATYSIEYIELCHAYWCSKKFINTARVWSDYASKIQSRLELTYDIEAWSALERVRERQELFEQSELPAPRLAVSLSDVR